jgi:hypothetical protein
MSKLHCLGRVMKRAQNENAPRTPAIEVCTPGSMAPGTGALLPGAASTSSMVGVVVVVATAATASASSGTLVCFLAFPVSCAIGDS